MLSHFHDVLLL